MARVWGLGRTRAVGAEGGQATSGLHGHGEGSFASAEALMSCQVISHSAKVWGMPEEVQQKACS